MYVVIILMVVIVILAFLIFKLAKINLENEVSGRDFAKFYIAQSDQYRSILYNVKKLLDIEAGGVYKRISENREILENLNESDCKALSETNLFWILDAHHQFLLSLAYEMKSQDVEFEMYSGCHRIDDIEIFKLVGEKLGKRPFVIERLSGLKEEAKSKWNLQ